MPVRPNTVQASSTVHSRGGPFGGMTGTVTAGRGGVPGERAGRNHPFMPDRESPGGMCPGSGGPRVTMAGVTSPDDDPLPGQLTFDELPGWTYVGAAGGGGRLYAAPAGTTLPDPDPPEAG